MLRILPTVLAALLLPPAATAAADPRTTAAPGRIAVTYDGSRQLRETFGALAAAPDGTVFAAGATGTRQRLAITAVRPDGSLARRFGQGGGAIAPFDVRDGDALLRAGDGTLIAIGRLPSDDGSSLGPPAAVRVRPDGSFDRGYGGDGVAEVPGISQLGCLGCGAAVLAPDGGVLVAGNAGRGPRGSRFAVARLRPDGTPDPAFGSGGVSRPIAGPGGAATLVVQPGGRIVALGFTGTGLDPAAQRSVLAGLRPDGSLDPTFGTGGAVELPASAFQLAQDAAGRLLVSTVGRSVPAAEDSAVLRFTPDGAPDLTWGAGGRTELGQQLFAEVLPTASGVVVAAAAANELAQIRLDGAGRIVARRTTRLRFGGGSFFPPRPRVHRGGFTAQSIVERADGSLALGGPVLLTLEADGGTVDRSEAGIAFVRENGALAPTITSGGPRIRPAILRERLRTIRRRRALRVRFRPGRRGLALVTATARGRTIARGTVPFWTGRRTTGRLRLTPTGRRLTGSATRLRVRVSVTRNDMPGNRASAVARATLRR